MALGHSETQCKLGGELKTLYEIEDVEVVLPLNAPQKGEDAAPLAFPPEDEKVLARDVLDVPEAEAAAFDESWVQLVRKRSRKKPRRRTKKEKAETPAFRYSRAFQDENGKLYVDTGLLTLQCRPSATPAQVEALLEKYELEIVFVFAFAEQTCTVKAPEGRDPLELSIALEAEEIVVFAEPEFLERIGLRFVPLDANYGQQWQFANTVPGTMGAHAHKPGAHVNAQDAWDYTQGAGHRIAVIDGTFDVNHVDLNIDNTRTGSFGGGVPTPFNPGLGPFPAATGGHGTRCAGMAAAVTSPPPPPPVPPTSGGVGMAIQAQLILLDTLADQMTTQATLSRSVAYAADPSREIQGADPASGAHVISCSLGPNGAPFALTNLLRQTIEFAARSGRGGRGTPVFWATDNNTVQLNIDQVCSHPDTVAIGRSWWRDAHHGSSFGPQLDLMAPGVVVYTTSWTTGLVNQYATPTGCSYAAPLTAGVAALVLANKFQPNSNPQQLIKVNRSLTWLEVKDLLSRSAVPIGLDIPATHQTTTSTGAVVNHWRDNSGNAVLNPNGTLVVTGPTNRLSAAAAAGATSLRLVSSVGFSAGQAVLLGVRTALTAVAGANLNISVLSTAGFQVGDNITLRTLDASFLISSAAAFSTTISVQDTTGFVAGDNVRINTGANSETVQITTVLDHTQLRITPALVNSHNWQNNIPVVRVAPPPRLANQNAVVAAVVNATTLQLNLVPAAFGIARTTLVERQGTEIRVIREVPSDGRTIVTDSLQNAQGINTPVQGGRTPHRSDLYGRGRVDALAAIRAAIAYQHDDRDLVIRKHSQDDGASPTDAQQNDVDSPDLWIRTTNPNVAPGDAGALPANYPTPGAHQKPPRAAPCWIYARVRNRGRTYNGLSFSVRTYLCLSDGTVPLSKADFRASRGGYNITSNTFGTQLLREKRFFNNTADAAYLNPLVPAPGGIDPTPTAVGGVALRPGTSTPPPPANSDVQVMNVGWTVANRPALPLGAANPATAQAPQGAPSAQPTAPVSSPAVSFQIENAHRYQVGQTLLIGLPGGGNYSAATIATIAGDTVTVNPPSPFTAAPATPRITGLASGRTTLAAAAVAGTQIRLASAAGFKEGDYILLGASGAATNEIHQIREIDHATAPPTATLVGPLAAPANHGIATPVTLIQGTPRLYVLAEITPHDGDLAGDHVYDNNNLSYREVFLQHQISFLNEGSPAALASVVQVDSGGSALTVGFRIRIEDAQTFVTENVRILVHRTRKSGTVETVRFQWNAGAGSWRLSDPAQTWLVLNAPVLTVGAVAAAGPQRDITLSGTYQVSRRHTRIRISANLPDQLPAPNFFTVKTYEAAVTALRGLPSGRAAKRGTGQPRLAGTQRLHCFADMTHLQQTPAQAFGPKSSHAFRLTSSLTSASATDTMAYAVLDSLVFLQENTANSTVNLVLRPLKQADIHFTKVKYFIYRGLRKADLIDPGNAAQVRPVAGNPRANFVDHLQQIRHRQNPGVALTLVDLNWDQKDAAERLDRYFFNADPNAQLPVVRRGMELGRFLTAGGNEIGFEIVLAEGHHSIPVGNLHAAAYTLNVAQVSSPEERRHRKEEILSYVDPAAYFGMHYFGKVFYPTLPDPDPNRINTTTITKNDIYNLIVAKFATRNTIYLDIRNEAGYSYNYYDNYSIPEAGPDQGKSIRIGPAPPEVSPLLADDYATLGWPLLLRDNQSQPTTTTNEEQNAVYLELRTADNGDPLLYLEYGFAITPSTRNHFIDGTHLRTLSRVEAIHPGTGTITVRDNLQTVLQPGALLHLVGNSEAAANQTYRVAAVAANVANAAHTDLRVDHPIPPAAAAARRRGRAAYQAWTRPIGLAFPNQPDTANRNLRRNVAYVLKLRYLRHLHPNARPITAVNQANRQFTLSGDVRSFLAPGDRFLVRNSVPAPPHHNDGQYTVAANGITLVGANTRITVVEPIPVAAANGEALLTPQKVVGTAHYTDQVFGSLQALTRRFPIAGITVTSPVQSIVRISGNHQALARQSSHLSLVRSATAAHNNRYPITAVALVGGHTDITITTAAALNSADTSGFVSLFHSIWQNPAPTRWLTGFDKRYVDARTSPTDAAGRALIRTAYVGQTGIALEADRVIFYLTPADFFEPPPAGRVAGSVTINGGTSTETAFWAVMQNQEQRLKLNTTRLRPTAALDVAVYDFEDYPGDRDHDRRKENFLALCVTKNELYPLIDLANAQLLDTHDSYLVLRNEATAADLNGVRYKFYHLKVTGWSHNAAGQLVERELEPNPPLLVYTTEEDPVIFTSAGYPDLGELTPNPKRYEEELRLKTEAVNILDRNAALRNLVNGLEDTLGGIDRDFNAIKNAVEAASSQLFAQAAGNAAVGDDRPLYWARLHIRAVVRNDNYIRGQRRRRGQLLQILEDRSRGIAGVNFGAAAAGDKKILLIAFDPYHLDSGIDPSYNLRQSNPAGAAALFLHGKTLHHGGNSGFVQSIVLPVRFRNLERGIVERLVLPLLSGANKVDCILTLDQGRSGRMDIERYAAKYRNPQHADNNQKKGRRPQYYTARNRGGTFKITRRSSRHMPEFLTTTLPIASLIPGRLGNNTLILNQSYTTDRAADQQALAAPNSGTALVAGPQAASKSRSGSAGDYIANEVFYRVAAIRQATASTTKTGHLSVPRIQNSGQDFHLANTQNLVTSVQTFLEDALAGL